MVFAIAAVLLLTNGCASRKLHNEGPNDWSKTYWAVVENLPGPGGASDAVKNLARLRAYHQALQDVAGATDLVDQFINCIQCDQLPTNAPPEKLKFIFYREHLDNMHAFTRAMKRVQASPLGDLNFILTYNTDPAPAADCPASCSPKTACWKGCDGNGSTAKCDKCP